MVCQGFISSQPSSCMAMVEPGLHRATKCMCVFWGVELRRLIFFTSHLAALPFKEENKSVNQPPFCNSWWFWLMEILDEFYTPSRMRLCSGDGVNRCIRDRNRVCTWFWHTVDIYLSGVWCSNLLKRNLHSCWGVNSVFCGSQPAGHHQMPSAFVILTRFKTRSTIPLSTCAERCGFHSAGCFVSLNALKHPSVFKSHQLSVFCHSCSRDIQMQNVHTLGWETKAAFGLNWTKVTESVNSTFRGRIPSTNGPTRGVFTKV